MGDIGRPLWEEPVIIEPLPEVEPIPVREPERVPA